MTAWPIPPKLDDIFDGDHRKADRAYELLWAHLISEHETYMDIQFTTGRELYDEHARHHSGGRRLHSPESLAYELGLIGMEVSHQIEKSRRPLKEDR